MLKVLTSDSGLGNTVLNLDSSRLLTAYSLLDLLKSITHSGLLTAKLSLEKTLPLQDQPRLTNGTEVSTLLVLTSTLLTPLKILGNGLACVFNYITLKSRLR